MMLLGEQFLDIFPRGFRFIMIFPINDGDNATAATISIKKLGKTWETYCWINPTQNNNYDYILG